MWPRAKWHKSLTNARIMEAVERQNQGLDDPGFCLACGEEAEGVEPDARVYCCEACGEDQVYGADEIMMVIGG